MTRFALLRHVQTEWNKVKRIQGVHDTPLTREGEAAASDWGMLLKEIRFDRIIVSSIGRAQATAGIINSHLNLPLHVEPGLVEQDWGRWTGKTVAQLRVEEPELVERNEAAGWAFRPPDGEDRVSVLDRSRKALMAAHEKWPEEVILTVTHEGVIKCLLNKLCGRKFLPSEPLLHNKNYMHWIRVVDGSFELEKIDALTIR